MKYLVFHIYAPMASWGTNAIGSMRMSDSVPSKSAILGMVAAALGITRDKEDQLISLNRGLRFAVRIDASGHLLTDYHTTQVGSGTKFRDRSSRRAELMDNPSQLNTILSTRQYRMDASYTIALWAVEGASYSLEQIQSALEQPQHLLFLGRKSCPLGNSLTPKIINADNLAGVFRNDAPTGPQRMVYWEGPDISIPVTQTETVFDRLISRSKWQFGGRARHQGWLTQGVGES